MTDKELRHLSRRDLLEMLIAQEKENIRLREALAEAEEQLKNRDIKISKAGSLAEASLLLNGVFEAAEAAAKQYYEVSNKPEEEKTLHLEDYGWYMNPVKTDDGIIYARFCGKLTNPNSSYAADTPELIVALKNSDGTEVVSETVKADCLLPEDSIILMGQLAVPIKNVREDTQITFDTSCRKMISMLDYSMKSVTTEENNIRSSELVPEAVNEKRTKDDQYTISGRIRNKASADANSVQVSLILEKDGTIVYMDTTEIEDIKAKHMKGFKFTRDEKWPENDKTEIFAQIKHN